MMRIYMQTNDDLSGPILRLALGVVMFPHGAQKVLGWFGGQGFSATMEHFTGTLGIPWSLGLLAILAEFLGAVSLVFGLFTRLCALGIGTVMVVGVWKVHFAHGFFMNWFGKQSGEGYEYHILAAGIALALVIRGGGRWSLDGMMTAKPRRV